MCTPTVVQILCSLGIDREYPTSPHVLSDLVFALWNSPWHRRQASKRTISEAFHAEIAVLQQRCCLDLDGTDLANLLYQRSEWMERSDRPALDRSNKEPVGVFGRIIDEVALEETTLFSKNTPVS